MTITGIKYINLNKNWRRKFFLKWLLSSCPFKVKRIPGVNFDSQKYSYKKYLAHGTHPYLDSESQRERKKGVIGCWIAHSHALEDVTDLNGITVVLEDDFICKSTFFEIALKMINELNKDFDIILFDTYGSGPLEIHKVAKNIYLPKNCNSPYYIGTHCAFVNNARIEKILDIKQKTSIMDYDGFLLSNDQIETFVFFTGECNSRHIGSDITTNYKAKYELIEILICFLPKYIIEKTILFKRYFHLLNEIKVIHLCEEKLKKFEGCYQNLNHNEYFLNVIINDGELVLIIPGQNENLILNCISDLLFVSNLYPMLSINFVKSDSNEIIQLTAFDNIVYQKINN